MRRSAGQKKTVMKQRVHALWQCFWISGLSCLLTLAGLEITLRFFPVQSYIPYQPVNSDSPVARYRPHRSFDYSNHWNFQNIHYGRTNAQGFVSDFDYNADDSRPLIAVIGDSYIEARMLNFSRTLQEKIRSGLHGAVRVYAFAMNGAALSQYLAFAKLARDTYRPDALIVNIVSNDFDESFADIRSRNRFHYFISDARGDLRPQLIGSYQISRLQEIISQSALVRYAYFHLRITDAPQKIKRFLRSLPVTARFQNPAPPASQSAKKAADNHETSLQAAKTFLKLLPEYAGLPPGKIILILDGQRRSLYYGPHKQDSLFESMRRYMLKNAPAMGYEMIDMHPLFQRDFQTSQQRFEFAHDAHWNARAHDLAARAVLMSQTIKRCFLNIP